MLLLRLSDQDNLKTVCGCIIVDDNRLIIMVGVQS